MSVHQTTRACATWRRNCTRDCVEEVILLLESLPVRPVLPLPEVDLLDNDGSEVVG